MTACTKLLAVEMEAGSFKGDLGRRAHRHGDGLNVGAGVESGRLINWNCASSAFGPFICDRGWPVGTGLLLQLGSLRQSCFLRTGWY